MIRTGIWKISQINQANDVKGFFGGTRRISIALYNELVKKSDELAEVLLLNYSDSRGAYKRTYRHRFENFDRTNLQRIKSAFPSNGSLRIHDMGVSDGRTALDFFALLAPEFPDLEYVASDFETDIHIHRDGEISVAIGRNGTINEIVYPPFVFNLSKLESASNYPVNHLVLIRAKQHARRIAAQANTEPSETIKLFCPDAVKLTLHDSRFRLAEHNLLDPLPAGKLHVIRAMNVLNASYFDQPQMEQIARHFHNALLDGGLVLFGSNEAPNTPIQGGVFRKTGNRFENIAPDIASIEATSVFDNFRA